MLYSLFIRRNREVLQGRIRLADRMLMTTALRQQYHRKYKICICVEAMLLNNFFHNLCIITVYIYIHDIHKRILLKKKHPVTLELVQTYIVFMFKENCFIKKFN